MNRLSLDRRVLDRAFMLWFEEAIRDAWMHGYRARIDDQEASMHGTHSIHMVPRSWLDAFWDYEKPLNDGYWLEPPGNPHMRLIGGEERVLAGLLTRLELAHSNQFDLERGYGDGDPEEVRERIETFRFMIQQFCELHPTPGPEKVGLRP